MHVDASELNALKTLVYAQRSIQLLGAFPERANLEARLKEAKKEWWKRMRTRYQLPKETKFSLELDGDLAGELRIKGSGGQPYTPWRSPYETAAAAPTLNRPELLDSLNAVFRDLGVEVVARR